MWCLLVCSIVRVMTAGNAHDVNSIWSGNKSQSTFVHRQDDTQRAVGESKRSRCRISRWNATPKNRMVLEDKKRALKSILLALD
jgi:hypothetical protein